MLESPCALHSRGWPVFIEGRNNVEQETEVETKKEKRHWIGESSNGTS